MPAERKEVKDSVWLQKKLVTLLEHASKLDDVDHQACAKYADLLWKMLPRTVEKSMEKQELDAIRERLIKGENTD